MTEYILLRPKESHSYSRRLPACYICGYTKRVTASPAECPPGHICGYIKRYAVTPADCRRVICFSNCRTIVNGVTFSVHTSNRTNRDIPRIDSNLCTLYHSPFLRYSEQKIYRSFPSFSQAYDLFISQSRFPELCSAAGILRSGL